MKLKYSTTEHEAGLDEAGRGCLAGPVFAAAVILPGNFELNGINDSKKLNKNKRNVLRHYIEENALQFAVAQVDNTEIDKINILWASVKAMHLAVDRLKTTPGFLIVDGNRFKPYKKIHHQCIVKGDALFAPIAAASILAKTYRDAYMEKIHEQYPQYGWDRNKGYPTQQHRNAINEFGLTPFHRKSFNLVDKQLKLSL